MHLLEAQLIFMKCDIYRETYSRIVDIHQTSVSNLHDISVKEYYESLSRKFLPSKVVPSAALHLQLRSNIENQLFLFSEMLK